MATTGNTGGAGSPSLVEWQARLQPSPGLSRYRPQGPAFNTKDAEAFAALFTDDAEYVNIFGQRMRRRDGIAAGHQAVFASLLAGARFTVTGTDVVPLGQDVALMHATWRRVRLPGATPATLPAGTGIFTFVARRAGDDWR